MLSCKAFSISEARLFESLLSLLAKHVTPGVNLDNSNSKSCMEVPSKVSCQLRSRLRTAFHVATYPVLTSLLVQSAQCDQCSFQVRGTEEHKVVHVTYLGVRGDRLQLWLRSVTGTPLGPLIVDPPALVSIFISSLGPMGTASSAFFSCVIRSPYC